MEQAVETVPREVADSIRAMVLGAVVGKPIFYSDTMKDLINRHCPEVYDVAEAAGCEFVPDSTEEPLLKRPPDLRWEIKRRTH